jgi:hypothetical protein
MSGSMIYLYLKTLDFIARYLGYIIVAESIIIHCTLPWLHYCKYKLKTICSFDHDSCFEQNCAGSSTNDCTIPNIHFLVGEESKRLIMGCWFCNNVTKVTYNEW